MSENTSQPNTQPDDTPTSPEADTQPQPPTLQNQSMLLRPPSSVLFLLLLLALAMRLFRLDYRSVWYDESFSIILARQDIGTIINGTAHDYHPPLYYLLLSGWMKIFGDGILATRLLSAILGVATVLLVYWLAKALFGPKTALLAGIIAAIAPFQILYSQEVRMYSLQALLGAWLALAFYRACRRDNRVEWALFGLAAILALYNLYFSLFGLAALDLFFIGLMLYQWRVRRIIEKGKIWRWFITNLMVGLLYLPWLFVLLDQVGRVKKSYWIAAPNPLEIFRLVDVFLYHATNLTVEPPFDLVGLLLAVFLLVFMLQSIRFRLRRGDKGRTRRSLEIALMLTYWLVPVVLVLVLSYLFTPLYLERSLIAFAVPCYILLARVVTTARRPNLWPLLLVPALGLALVSLYFYFFSETFTVHYDAAAASSYISQNYRSGDLVIHTNKLSYLPFVYLKAPGQQLVVPEEPGNPHDDLSPQTRQAIGLEFTPIEQIATKLGPDSRLWLVLTPPQPGQTDYQERIVKGYLDGRYRLISSRTFYGSTIFLYQSTST